MIELIPAIDIIDGKCVRLAKGDYENKTEYSESPVDVAKAFQQMGFQRLHIVDLDGARSKHMVNSKILNSIASATSLQIDFGGGIKSDNDIAKAFDYGASMVTIGSMAVTDTETVFSWIKRYGAEKIIIGADVKGTTIAVNGWQEETSEELLPFIHKYVQHGINKFLCTDISRDGMLNGPSLNLYKKILSEFPKLHLIASGGVSSNKDIYDLEAEGVPAVVFGKAFYEGKINVEQLINHA